MRIDSRINSRARQAGNVLCLLLFKSWLTSLAGAGRRAIVQAVVAVCLPVCHQCHMLASHTQTRAASVGQRWLLPTLAEGLSRSQHRPFPLLTTRMKGPGTRAAA